MAAKRTTDSSALLALGVEPCAGSKLEKRVDLPGNLVAEVTVVVRRRVSATDANALRAELVAFLRAVPEVRERCGSSTTKRDPWSYRGSHKSCSKPISVAIPGRAWAPNGGEGERRWDFYCTVHGDQEAQRGATVIAVPRDELLGSRRRAEARSAERYRAERAAEEMSKALLLLPRWLAAPCGHEDCRRDRELAKACIAAHAEAA